MFELATEIGFVVMLAGAGMMFKPKKSDMSEEEH